MNRRKTIAASAMIALSCGLTAGLATSPATAQARRVLRPTVRTAAKQQYRANPAWCKFSDTLPMEDMSDQQMMDEMDFYPRMKADLTPSTCQKVSTDLAAAKAYGLQFPTAAKAIAGGFHMVAPYIPGQGAHYMGPNGFGPTFDPKVPNFLLFDGNGPNAKLAGLMWLVNSGQAPPKEGYPGGNDHWHRHGIVCMVGGLILGDGISDAACAAMGGVQIDISSLWMLHAWIVPGMEYLPDVFRPHVPMLH